MKRETSYLIFASIFLILLLAYFFVVFNLIRSYDKVSIMNEKEGLDKIAFGGFYSLGLDKDSILKITLFADLILLSISIVIFVILIFLSIRKRDQELTRKMLANRSKGLLKEMRSKNLDDKEIIESLKRKGWAEDDIRQMMSG